MKFEFSLKIFENTPISNFTKIRLVGAELFQLDGRTDGQTNRHEKDYSLFRNLAKAPKNEEIHLVPPVCPCQN